ncbi:MAG: hypothetical protein PVI60_15080, partial [Desulfobacteraceae bacterium]
IFSIYSDGKSTRKTKINDGSGRLPAQSNPHKQDGAQVVVLLLANQADGEYRVWEEGDLYSRQPPSKIVRTHHLARFDIQPANTFCGSKEIGPDYEAYSQHE